METFNLWAESLIFLTIFSVIIIVPCAFVALLGREMIDQLGYFPTKTPVIQMSIFLKLASVKIITFLFLISFFRVFGS